VASVSNGNAEDHRQKDIQRQTSRFLHKDPFGCRPQIGSSVLGHLMCRIGLAYPLLSIFLTLLGRSHFVVAYSKHSNNIKEIIP